jgi:hypothetical protein
VYGNGGCVPSPADVLEPAAISGSLGDDLRKAATRSAGVRVRLTVGNRPVYRGNQPYRPGPVTVPAGYQPLGLGNFEFEF